MQGDDAEVIMKSASTRRSIPKMMNAEVIDRFGPPEKVMHTAKIPVPELDDRDVLIDVRTAGVGSWDPELCEGEWGDGDGFPRVLGSDGSGTIVATGSRVRRFAIGDRVYAYGFMNPKGGFFAEYTAVPEDEVARVPETLSLNEAGAMAVDGLTALAGLDAIELKRRQTIAIYGASGGVGHLALQLAKRIGARVFAIASGRDGVALARRLGADEAIEGHADDIADKARAFAPDGLDAALVFAAGADELLQLVKKGARVAYPNGVEPPPRKRRGITVDAYDGYDGRDALERLNKLIAKGPFHVEVSKKYPLAKTPKALTDVSRHHLGKLAVQVHRG
jgi:NADPH:quinone reductase-like Zn-dependent oxidoreductase